MRSYHSGLLPPACGADDKQANCIARLAPLVAAFAGDERLMQCVQFATRVTQNTDEAVAWACAGAAVLEHIILGATAHEAVAHTVEEFAQGSGETLCFPIPPLVFMLTSSPVTAVDWRCKLFRSISPAADWIVEPHASIVQRTALCKPSHCICCLNNGCCM